MDIKFFFIGIVAAIFANMTGTGGGIVFFPAFVAMGVTPPEAAATSMLIQSFGMTSGSISWLVYFKRYKSHLKLLLFIVMLSSLLSMIGAYTYIFTIHHVSLDIHFVFRVLSIVIAALLLSQFFRKQLPAERIGISSNDIFLIAVISFVGGMVTAITSIGVGELLAGYLLIKGFRVDLAIAAAVVVSAFTVITLLPHFVFFTETARMGIAFSAIPGAILGGYAARYIAKIFSLKKLKIVFIVWILISSFV